MNTIAKLYIGRLGWYGNATHAIHVDETDDGTVYKSEPYAICKPHTFHHYRIGLVNGIRKVQATKANVTCKDCKKNKAVA